MSDQQSPKLTQYQRLAPRHLLSATFSLLGGTLALNDFDAGQDLTFSQSEALVNGTLADAYTFELANGSWNGSASLPGMELSDVNGGFQNQLRVATSVFGGDINSQINIDGATGTPLNIDVDQLSLSFVTGEMRLSNLTAVDNRMDFNIDGAVVLNNLSVVDSNPLDSLTTASGISVTGRGGLEVAGDLTVAMNHPGAGISLVAFGDSNDVNVLGRLSTVRGDVNIFADDSITLGDSSLIVSGNDGDVLLRAGQDDFSQIEMSDGARIETATGTVTLDLVHGQHVLLGNIRSANASTDPNFNAISIFSAGDVLDNTGNEQANLFATDGNVFIRSDGSIGLTDSLTADLEVTSRGLLAQSIAGTFLQTDITQLDVSVSGDLVVHNSGSLELVDLNNDSIALQSDGDQARLLLTAGPELTIVNSIIATNANRLSIFATETIESLPGADVRLDQGHLQVNAAQQVYIGSDPSADVRLRSIGVVTGLAYIETDSSIVIDGSAPNVQPSVFGTDASFGTRVEQTLFVIAGGDVMQTTGQLQADQLAIDAAGFVHLSRISDVNKVLAITARGESVLSDATMQNQLTALANIPSSEVDATSPQSIAFIHDGTATIGTVASPTGTSSVTGLNSFRNSIFVSATETINFNADITAVSTSAIVSPQATLYVANGTNTDPQINFNDFAIRVSDPRNVGVVNSPFTTATFFDAQGFVFRGTTEDLVLNPDGSANQNIVIEYGHPGEAGYRVGVFWDNGVRPNNRTGQPLENLNTFVPNINDSSEAYNDFVYQNFTSTLHPIVGNEGGARETFGKIGPYSKEAIINHTDEPKVFSLVTVRNDQNINLFAGDLATANNSLNETGQVIRADLDSPKRFAIQLPPISNINPIEIRTNVDAPITGTTPQDVTINLFDRELLPFETGELKWVAVEIPLADLSEVGDEVRIKNPAKVYPAEDDAEAIRIDNSIGENEVEKIIGEIERNRDAEPGFWYKVFKDYKNRDDELFFYHLKTGEVPQPDAGPASDFGTDSDFGPESNFESEPAEKLDRDPESNDPGPIEKLTSPVPDDEEPPTGDNSELELELGFNRYDRMKRRWFA